MEDTSFDNCYQFWIKIQDKEVQQQFIDVFTTRLLEETDDALDIGLRVVSSNPMSKIKTYLQFNMSAYVFVSIFRTRIPMSMIDELFLVVWNSKTDRDSLLDKIAVKFINKIQQKKKRLL